MARAKKRRTTSRKVAKRAAPKKKAPVKKQGPRNFLNAALYDVRRELNKLKTERLELNTKLESTKRAMARARVEEARLRDDLSKVVAREGIIGTRTTNIRNKIEKVKNRLIQVTKIRDELGGEEEA